MFDSLKRTINNSAVFLYTFLTYTLFSYFSIILIPESRDVYQLLFVGISATVTIITILTSCIYTHRERMKDNRNKILNRLLQDNSLKDADYMIGLHIVNYADSMRRKTNEI